MFADVKADTRRIPDRYHQNQEVNEPETLPEPILEPLSEPPAPEPVVEVLVEEPAPIEETVEEVVTEYNVEPAPVAPALDEVEYTWHDWSSNGASNGAVKPSKNGRHKSTTPAPSLRPWPAEPMIHRPDWW